jgi:hypothetical protein
MSGVGDETPVTREANEPDPPEPPAVDPVEPVEPVEPTEPVDSTAQIAALEAERDALRSKLDTRERRQLWGRRLRSIGVVVLVVLAVICFIAANIGGWARRNLLNTDRFGGTAQDLIENQDIRDAVSTHVTAELVQIIDPAAIFNEVLPDRARILAVPLANAVQEFLGDQVDRFVSSDAFEGIFVAVVRVAHETALRVLRGDTENVQISDGVITINLLPVINAVLGRIENLVPEIFGRSINLPEIGAGDVPEAARERLSSALGVDLDDDFGVIKIYDADRVQAAQDALRLFERGVIVLWILTVGFAALALWLSRRRRRTLLQLTVGAILGLVVVRRLGFWFLDNLGTRQASGVDRRAVHSAGEILLDSFFLLTAWLLVLLVVVAIVAAVTGPYPWAVWLRGWITGTTGQGNAWLRSQTADSGPLRWIVTHREALQIGGLVLAVLIVLIFDLSWVGLLLLAILLAAYLLVVHQIARDRPIDETGTPGPDDAAAAPDDAATPVQSSSS